MNLKIFGLIACVTLSLNVKSARATLDEDLFRSAREGNRAASSAPPIEVSEFEDSFLLTFPRRSLTSFLVDPAMNADLVNATVFKLFKSSGYRETPREGSRVVPEHSSLRPLLDSPFLTPDSINRLFVWSVSHRHSGYEADLDRLFNDPRLTQESLDWAAEVSRSQRYEDLLRRLETRSIPVAL